MDNINDFMKSIRVPNTFKVVKFVFKNVKEDIIDYNIFDLENFIINLNPKSPKEITTICYVLSLYAKWLCDNGLVKDDSMYNMIQSLDKKLLWKKAKPLSAKKFISYEQYRRILHDIGVYENFNQLYYESLFACVYEGIYNENLSVIKNLKGSDINENIVTLNDDDGHSYKLKISYELAESLKKLSNINIWERQNRYGICKVNMKGLYSDTVFKIEDRSTNVKDSYRFTYYNKLRKISKEYVEYPLLPLQLYASGIMHRIKIELEKNDITLKDAFADNSRNKMAHSIIEKELIRCNSRIETGNFRELVKGHLDSF